MRLNQFLARAGVASRRKAEEFILAGKITVNGVITRQLAVEVNAEKDQVCFEKRPLTLAAIHQYWLFYKPRQVLVTKRDPQGRKTVFDLLKFLPPVVNAVGRLDYDSEGLLLLTDDGDLAYRITHPSYEILKTYYVQLDHLPDLKAIQTLERGIQLDEGKTAPARIQRLNSAQLKPILEPKSFSSLSKQFWLSIQIHEGKKRQVRRMFEWAGCQVRRLIRVQLGKLDLQGLRSGEWRELTEAEVNGLRFV